jgi:hypothetical protein
MASYTAYPGSHSFLPAARGVASSFLEALPVIVRFISFSLFRFAAIVVVALGVMQAPPGVAAEDIKDAWSESDTGLVGDDAWVSPQFGTEAGWTGEWLANELETVSDPDMGQDQLRLNWSEGRGAIHIIRTEDGRGGPPEDVAFWTSDEFLLNEPYAHVDEVVVLLEHSGSGDQDGGVLIGLADAGDPTAWLHYAQSVPTGDGGALFLTLDAPVEEWPEVLESARAGVTVDGGAAFDVFDIADVEAAVDDAPVVEFDQAAAGLVDDDLYIGPAFGDEVAWPESWALNVVIRYPVLSKAAVAWDEVHIAETGTAADPPPFFDFYSMYPRQTTAAQELAIFVDPEWVSLGFREEVDVTVLLQAEGDAEAEALVAVTFPETGEIEYAWFRWTRDEGESDQYFYLKARSEDFTHAWDVLTGEIILNGDAIDVMFSDDDVEEAIAGFED